MSADRLVYESIASTAEADRDILNVGAFGCLATKMRRPAVVLCEASWSERT
jgi:hypothetical protein